MTARLSGPGLYSTIAPPHPRDDLSDLHRTHKDRDCLPAMLEAQERRPPNRRRVTPESAAPSRNLPEARELARILTADLFNGERVR
jgi:hypothetical protein